MNETAKCITALAQEDRRYAADAYFFVLEALGYAQRTLGMGQKSTAPKGRTPRRAKAEPEQHLTGQELCEAIRVYALEQFGYMAKCVLNNWGVRTTGDIGEIVFNMIRAGQMRKTPDDRREDFDDNFDFDTALVKGFRITEVE